MAQSLDLLTGQITGTPEPVDWAAIEQRRRDAQAVAGGAALAFWPEEAWYYKRSASQLEFEQPARPEDLLTFARDSAASDFGVGDPLVFAAMNRMRVSRRGALLEPASVNLWHHSEDYTQSIWGKPASTVAPDQAYAPNGALTADRVTADAGSTSGPGIRQALSVTAGSIYTASHFVGYGNHRYLNMWTPTAIFGTAVAQFDLLTGAHSAFAGTGLNVKSYMEPVRPGWWRLGMRGEALTTTSGVITLSFVSSAASGRNETINMAGTEYFDIWGGMAANARYLGSYIKTPGAATAARGADIAYYTLPAAWFNPSAWTVLTDMTVRGFSGSGVSGNGVQLALDGNNRLLVAIDQQNAAAVAFAQVGGATVFNTSMMSGLLVDDRLRIAMSYDGTTFRSHVRRERDGATATFSAALTAPAFTTFVPFGNANGSNTSAPVLLQEQFVRDDAYDAAHLADWTVFPPTSLLGDT